MYFSKIANDAVGRKAGNIQEAVHIQVEWPARVQKCKIRNSILPSSSQLVLIHSHDGDKQGQIQSPHLCHIHNSHSSSQSQMVIIVVNNEAVLVTKNSVLQRLMSQTK